MLFVNVDRGREEGQALARTLEELSRENDEVYVHDDSSNLSQEVRDGLEESFSYQRT
jgi:UMF1 family MFS transporter